MKEPANYTRTCYSCQHENVCAFTVRHFFVDGHRHTDPFTEGRREDFYQTLNKTLAKHCALYVQIGASK